MFALFSLLALIGEQSACFPGIFVSNAFDIVNFNSVNENKVKISNLLESCLGQVCKLQFLWQGTKFMLSWKIGCNDLMPTSVNADFLP